MKTKLTEQQFKIGKLVEEGLSEAEIAIFLGVGEKAVNRHIANLCRKAGTKTRKELAKEISSIIRRTKK